MLKGVGQIFILEAVQGCVEDRYFLSQAEPQGPQHKRRAQYHDTKSFHLFSFISFH